jgi:hypothetical protein
MDEATGAAFTSGSPLAVDNLIVTTGTWGLGIRAQFEIKNNITVALNATLNLNPSAAGIIVFNGITGQSISGSGVLTANSFQGIALNNLSGLSIDKDLTLAGAIILTNGRITLGSSNLTLESTATFGGTFSEANMIVATGNGQLRKSFAPSFTGSFVFPVGDNTVTAEYSPVTLNFTSGTFASGNYAGVNLVNAKYPGDTNTGSYLKRYWNVTQSGITSFTCDATFQYVPADVNGTESLIYCVKVDPTPFVAYDIANTTDHKLTATGLTTFSTFTGTQVSSVPAVNNLSGTVANGITGCYNATQTIYVAQTIHSLFRPEAAPH